MRRGRLPIGVAYVTGAALLLGLLARDTWGQSPALTHRVVVPLVASDPAALEPTPTPEPTPTASLPTSYQLINAALNAGAITSDQAAMYRVFATFSDPRLPAAYQGDDEFADTPKLWTNWDSLAPDTREVLLPFKLRPDDPGSWVYTTQAGVQASGAPVSAAARPPGQWLNKTGNWVRVQYDDPAHAARADAVLEQAENLIWPKLRALLGGKQPAKDCLLFCGDKGGSDHLDIYLTSIARSEYTTEGDCSGNQPGFIEFGHGARFGTLAHELMHAFQLQFKWAGANGCNEYDWVHEGTAKWATDYVYGWTYNSYEHTAWKYLEDPTKPLTIDDDHREYGVYIFFFYLTRIGASEAEILKIFNAAANETDSLKAVNGAIPGGFQKHFHEFVKYNWNPDPRWAPLNQYHVLDGITDRAKLYSGTYDSTIKLGGSLDKGFKVPGINVGHVSSVYYEFTINPDVSTLAFFNGFTYDLDLKDLGGGAIGLEATQLEDTAPAVKHGKVWALVKKAGKDWMVEDWSKTPIWSFCLDNPNDRLERLVLIFSNANYDRNSAKLKPGNLDPTFWASNMGCWKWKGTASYISADGLDTTTANVTFEYQGIQTQQQASVAGAAAGQKYTAIGLNYLPIEGSVTFRSQGTDWAGCTHSGGPTTFPFGALSQELNVFVTFNLVVEGTLKRTYAAIGFTPLVTKTIYCPPSGEGTIGGTDVIQLKPLWLVAGNEQQGFLTVSQDGRTIQGTFGDDARWTWNFRAVRE